MLTVTAPAKINLTLEVLGKRPDGYHEIRSVVQTVSLRDELTFDESQGISIVCDMPGWSAEKSLVSRAVALVKEAAGCTGGAAITVNKNIPLMSGLGGDSSNAAAVLKGLNQFWQLGLSVAELEAMAGQLGSDVGFFLKGGTALAEGRGERITPLPPLPRSWAVLVVPEVTTQEGKTARMYSSLTNAHYTDGKITERLMDDIKQRGALETSLLFNAFENIAFDRFEIRRVYVEHLLKLGAPHVHLAGSGPTLFTMYPNRPEVEDLFARCQGQGMAVYLVETV